MRDFIDQLKLLLVAMVPIVTIIFGILTIIFRSNAIFIIIVAGYMLVSSVFTIYVFVDWNCKRKAFDKRVNEELHKSQSWYDSE